MSITMHRRAGAAVGGVASLAMIVGGGVSMASPAHADTSSPTPPTVSLQAPAQVYNAGDNTPYQPLQITVDNTAVGSLKTINALTISLAGSPNDPSCNNVSLQPNAIDPGPALAKAGCTWTVTKTVTAKANGTLNGGYQVVVDTRSGAYPNGRTGTLTWSISDSVTYPTFLQPNPDVVTGPMSISNLVGQSAPLKVADAPAATVYRAYNHQVIKPGVPHGTTTVKNVSKNTVVAASKCQVDQLGGGYKYCFKLNDGLEYNSLTGYITRSTQLNYRPDLNPNTYRINTENISSGPPTAANSLGSATVTVAIPNLFSDVPANNTFADAIYTLGNDGVLGGFTDGTFRPTTSTLRQEIAHYIYQVAGPYTDGACTTNKPSAFSDVPNTSPFCKSIRALSQDGVIKGFANGKFQPTAPVARQGISAMFYRTYQFALTGNSSAPDAQCGTPIPFNDVSSSNPFCGDIEWMDSTGLSKGFADGGFHPKANTLRQETAAFVYRFITTPSIPGSWKW